MTTKVRLAVRSLVIGGQIAINGVVGLLFARLLANKMGVTSLKDSFDAAYSVPFVILAVSGMSWLHSVVTSQIARSNNDTERAQCFFSWGLRRLLYASLFICSLAFIFSGVIADFLVPGLSQDSKSLVANLIAIMVFLTFTLGLSTYFSAAILAYEIPVGMEAAQLISRGGAILAVLLFGYHGPISLAWSLLIWSVAGLVIFVVLLYKYTPLRLFVRSDFSEAGEVYRQGAWFVAAAVAAQLPQVQILRLASATQGNIALLGYAGLLGGALSTVIGKGISQAVSPRIARGVSNSNYYKLLGVSIGISALPALIIWVFSYQITSIVFSGGLFTTADVLSTSGLVRLFALIIPVQVGLWIVLPKILKCKSVIAAPMSYVGASIFLFLIISPMYDAFGLSGIVSAQLVALLLHLFVGVVLTVKG